MKQLRNLLIVIALLLLAVSVWLEFGLHARYLDWTEPALTTTGRYPAININTYKTREEAEAACGERNIVQLEIIRRTGSYDGPFGCRSDFY